ncbi:MAG: hypothetical protein Q7W44_09245 [Coriobacteriia bacterium]|nr:hypothetical protein [Coriobacteriia bacterium]
MRRRWIIAAVSVLFVALGATGVAVADRVKDPAEAGTPYLPAPAQSAESGTPNARYMGMAGVIDEMTSRASSVLDDPLFADKGIGMERNPEVGDRYDIDVITEADETPIRVTPEAQLALTDPAYADMSIRMTRNAAGEYDIASMTDWSWRRPPASP